MPCLLAPANGGRGGSSSDPHELASLLEQDDEWQDGRRYFESSAPSASTRAIASHGVQAPFFTRRFLPEPCTTWPLAEFSDALATAPRVEMMLPRKFVEVISYPFACSEWPNRPQTNPLRQSSPP